MSFTASKLLWYVAAPTNLIVLLLLAGLVLQVTRWRRFGRRLVLTLAVVLVAVAVLPVGQWLLRPLENRFPAPTELPAQVDGVILLGGATNLALSETRAQPSFNDAAERIFAFVELAQRYPEASLVVSGGSGRLFPGRLRESDVTRDALRQIGFDVSRVIFEEQSRNTFENALYTHEAIKPKTGEVWVLVTSAAHMPRAVGSFRRTGWAVLAYPVDYLTPGRDGLGLRIGLGAGLAELHMASHEWAGLLVYWLLGRSEAPFPGPGAPGAGPA